MNSDNSPEPNPQAAIATAYAHERAAYLASLCDISYSGEAGVHEPEQVDFPANLVVSKWGTNPDRLQLDHAWRDIWRVYARNDLHPPVPVGTGDLYFNEAGEEIDLLGELGAQFRAKTWRQWFCQRESFRRHVRLLDTGDPRTYLYREYSYKTSLEPKFHFALGAPNPAYWFAFGNYAKNCLAFHAAGRDNSDVMFTYLLDDSVSALEIYLKYRPIGQAWLVRGADTAGNSLLVDSVEFYPTNRALAERLHDPLLRACERVADYLNSKLLLNVQVYTLGAASLVAAYLDRVGITYRLERPRIGCPLLTILDAGFPRYLFERERPWSESAGRLRKLGISCFRYYLDAWAGFVDESYNAGEILAIPWDSTKRRARGANKDLNR